MSMRWKTDLEELRRWNKTRKCIRVQKNKLLQICEIGLRERIEVGADSVKVMGWRGGGGGCKKQCEKPQTR